jgi:hypothetical protein
METSTLPFSPFDYDVNVLVFKSKHINDDYFDNLLLVVANNDSHFFLTHFEVLHLLSFQNEIIVIINMVVKIDVT